MIVLGCNNVSLSFGTDKILENINFSIQDSDKAGIIGVNGAGKSTLFKIISGSLQPDGGEVFLAKGRRVGYLEQNTTFSSENTVLDEVMSMYSVLIQMEARLKTLEESISKERDDEVLSSLMKEYSRLSDEFSRSGGYEYNSRVKGVLHGLGFNENQFNLSVQALSGGQKTRLALVKALLDEPDLLLLDEPTNHLDISSLEWLEYYLTSYKKSVIIISHDRYFLDRTVNRIIELENCNASIFAGNYSSYMKYKEEARKIQQKHFEMQQKEIAKMEAFIEQQRRWNREKNIVAAESRQKAIDRIEKIDAPKNLPQKIRIKFRSGIISGNDVLFVEDLCKEYPGKQLFSNISFKLRKNEKVFLLGPNGCGKSTMIKIIAGRLEASDGTFEYGHNVRIGYYDQEQEELDESKTILDELWDANENLTNTQIRNVLAMFLFQGEDVFKPISKLSGGEKGRVSLAKLMLSDANLLILDEPTNHLDINSREALEDALLGFDGTILAVSHDRYFIDKMATRILEFENKTLRDIDGNYSFYLNYKSKPEKYGAPDVQEKASAAKQEFLESKEEKAKQRRLEKQLADTENEITTSEERLKKIDEEMLRANEDCDHVKLMQLHVEQQSLTKRLEELYELWEELETQKQNQT